MTHVSANIAAHQRASYFESTSYYAAEP